jgi:hypothetical protein
MSYEAPVRSDILSRPENIKRERDRPKLTWKEVIKRDMKEYNISKELVSNKSACKMAIHVPKL